jgi:ribosome maturation factor RimP
MISKETLEKILDDRLSGTEIFPVEIFVGAGNRISVSLDKPEGISIDECVEISRHINAVLDREIEDYELEVSSPGLDSAFMVSGQYLKNLGKNVQLVLNDGTKLKGILKAYTGEGIEIEYTKVTKKPGSTRKEKNLVCEFFSLDSIKSTKSVISF